MASHHKEMSKTKDKTKDMEKIMVTAVVVTYNRKALLEKVIRSLLAQTVEIGRIIIVNNGSTDGRANGSLRSMATTLALMSSRRRTSGAQAASTEVSKKPRRKSATGYGVWTTMYFREKTVWIHCSM